MNIRHISYFWSVSFLLTQSIQAIDIDGYSTGVNNRFDNDAQFIANGYDLSGVAITDSGRWVTMVSDSVFLTSNHFAPSVNESVTFYASNDPTGLTATRSVAGLRDIAGSDLQVGVLDIPLESSFATYSFATQDTTNNNTWPGSGPSGANNESFINSPYFFSTAFLFGRSPGNFENTASISQDMAIGQNVLDVFINTQAQGTTDYAFAAVDNQSGVSHESFLQIGDSGAPMMVYDGSGNLTLVGINWFTGTLGSGENVSGFSYTGNYDDEIQSYVDNPALVPEPATYGILLGLTALLLVVRCRRRA